MQRIKPLSLGPALAIAFVLTCIAAAGDRAPLALGGGRLLMLERDALAAVEGAAAWRAHEPAARQPVLQFDAPWEGRYSGYVTVFEDGDKVRVYYRGLPEAGKDGSNNEVTCYAESSDGIHFTKPNLGIFEVDGSRDNNVVLAGQAPFSHNFAPFADSRPGTPPEARYKAVAGTAQTGLHAWRSADGIHWEQAPGGPIITEGAFDSQNVAFWSSHEEQYVCYLRTWKQLDWGNCRWISRSTSPDFKTWSKPREMAIPLRSGEHVYTNQTLAYPRAPRIYLGFAARFLQGRRVVSNESATRIDIEAKYAGDCSDSILLVSKEPLVYHRPEARAFIRPAMGAGHWTSRTNYPAHGLVFTNPGEMSLYVQHFYGQPRAELVRYTLRSDGFASVDAPLDGGSLTTVPLSFSGDRLLLNMATAAAGGIRAELREPGEEGRPYPGYALEDCMEMVGNSTDAPVEWSQGGSLAPLSGQPVVVHIQLRDAAVYALRFATEKEMRM